MNLPIIRPTDRNWLVLWGVPMLSIVAILIASQMNAAAVEWMVVSPFGFSENLPTAFIIVGVLYAIAIARLPQGKHLKGWMVVYILALIFFAGEDQNWFQYWLGVTPPDFFLAHNKEQETNLHNMSTWFNQKPRLVVEVWALIACILVPLGWWTWPKDKTKKWVPADLWPDTRVVTLAVLTLLIGQSRRLFKYLLEAGIDIQIPDLYLGDGHNVMHELFPGVRISELEEIGFAYLMLVFPALLFGRLVSQKVTAAKAKRTPKKFKKR